jgi:hypothetical protein
MRRNLSSSITFFYKWVFDPVWILGCGFVTCMLWLDAFRDRAGNPPDEWIKLLILVGLIAGSAFGIWFSMRLKRVQVDDEAIYVSNYLSEYRIPFIEISHITNNYLYRPQTVTIHLRNSSPFGNRIVFIPKFDWVLFGAHTVITELQTRCDRANAR